MSNVFVYNIPRESTSHGLAGGAALGRVISGMPASAAGQVLISFDGWEDDSRGLWEIPEIVEFCNGIIYGDDPSSNPDAAHPAMARAVLPFLVNEVDFVNDLGKDAWSLSGRNWVVSIAHAAYVYQGSVRNVGLAANLCHVFLNEGEFS